MLLLRRAGLLAVVAPRPAAAHALVLHSDPAAGAVLARLPARALLRFNSRIDAARSRLTLIGPGGVATPLVITAHPDVTTIEAPLRPDAPGAWRLRWQVLAADGHITRGDIAFTIDPG